MRLLLPLLIVLGAALALPALLSPEQGPLDDAARQRAPGQFMTLPQGTTHYQLLGGDTAPLVVMVHGFSVPSFTWIRNAPALAAQGHRVLTYDLFGRGYSDRPPLPYDRNTFVTQLNALLTALKIETPVHLVGVSMGGGVVAAFAATYPERVASVALLAPFNQPVDIGPLAWPILGDYLARVAYLPTLAEQQVGDAVEPGEREFWLAQFDEQRRFNGFDDAIIATATHYLQQDPGPDIQALAHHRIPVLLMWGERDTVFPFSQAPDVLAKLDKDTPFVAIPDTGHALHYQDAETVNETLITFWASYLQSPTR